MLVQSLSLEDPWWRAWPPTAVFLPGEFHAQRSLAGYSPRGRKESDLTQVTEQQQQESEANALTSTPKKYKYVR